MQECLERCWVYVPLTLEYRLTDLIRMNIRSARFHKESANQLWSPYAWEFDTMLDMVSYLQKYRAKT